MKWTGPGDPSSAPVQATGPPTICQTVYGALQEAIRIVTSYARKRSCDLLIGLGAIVGHFKVLSDGGLPPAYIGIGHTYLYIGVPGFVHSLAESV